MASSSITATTIQGTRAATPAASTIPRTQMFTGGFPVAPSLWLSDTGSDPAQWDDLSGNGRHATQSTGANQPSIQTNVLNGRQVRRFDGTNDGMTGTMTLAQPFTIYSVFKVTNTSPTQSVFHGSSQSCGVISNTYFAFSGSLISGGSPDTNFTSIGWVFNGANSLILKNGVIVVSADASTNGIADFSIGYRSGPDDERVGGDIAEIIVFPSALTAIQRKTVEAYLNRKYAIY